jgi:hypothetical protein
MVGRTPRSVPDALVGLLGLNGVEFIRGRRVQGVCATMTSIIDNNSGKTKLFLDRAVGLIDGLVGVRGSGCVGVGD